MNFMQVQTQYIFAVYCVVQKIPFWLDPPPTTTTTTKTRPRTSLTHGQKVDSKEYLFFTGVTKSR